MKKLQLALVFVCLAVSRVFAADTTVIETTFQRYWTSFAKGDGAKAAAEVLPSDLEDLKAALLPVFLDAQKSSSKETQQIVGTFFDKTVGSGREKFSSVDVYTGFNRLVTALNPQVAEAMKATKPAIIITRNVDADNAEVHFQIVIGGEPNTDAQLLTKKNGRWWVRLEDDPKQVAAGVKQMLAQP